MEVNPNFSVRAREDYEFVVKAVEDGDQSAFAALLSRYRESIYHLILKMVKNLDDADDLTIETFGKAFSNLEKYSPNYAFSTWLYKIALNNCIDYIRKKRIETFSLDKPISDDEGDPYVIDVKTTAPDPEEIFIRQQRARLMRETLDKLNPKYKKLIELRFFDELSYEEIADKMKLPLGTVKAQLFRAKDLLLQILKPKKERI
jgi:RNA polymerase sigma factor (sigma-70 family)